MPSCDLALSVTTIASRDDGPIGANADRVGRACSHRHHVAPRRDVALPAPVIADSAYSSRDPRLGGGFLAFGHADSSAAATERYPTPRLRCRARFDISVLASRRIAA